MIIDRIENRDLYQNVTPVFKQAMDFMASLAEQPVGRYEVVLFEGQELTVSYAN